MSPVPHVTHFPRPGPLRRAQRQGASCASLAGAALAISLLAGCSGGGGPGVGPGILAGEEAPKPGGGTYFADPHQGGSAPALRVSELFWGRLVDVHDIDPGGNPNAEPVFTDFVINENVITDGTSFLLETNAVTQTTRLVIRRQRSDPVFGQLVKSAGTNLPAVLPKHDDGTSPEPFSLVARNAVVVIRFDDLLDDGASATSLLGETVRVRTGYPPVVPFTGRILFDPNHGGVANGAFHSTRILIDLTVTESEASASPVALPINALGLPASRTNTGQPNASIRMPALIDVGSGQFNVLTNLRGAALSTSQNGPIDTSSPTADVVRSLRSGNASDLNNGFLLDLEQPRIIGSFGTTITAALEEPGASPPGSRFLVDVRFETRCAAAPLPGDVLVSGQRLLEVLKPAASPDLAGLVENVSVRVVGGGTVPDAAALLGGGSFLTPYDPFLNVDPGCWLAFVPNAVDPPATGVSKAMQAVVRFSEPMDPGSVSAFESFRAIRGLIGIDITPREIVVGQTSVSLDLRDFTLSPLLPLSGQNSSIYYIQLAGGANGVTDLAGNALADELPPVQFTLDPGEPVVANAGVGLRFSGPDELDPIGLPDFRGQANFDTARQIVKSREVAFLSLFIDRSRPIVEPMFGFPPGVQTPLVPLGSKLQTVWRYADVGWRVRDESKYNMDVIGMSWSPLGGQVVSDFFSDFEMRLSHCVKLPDENHGSFGPTHVRSGIGKTPHTSCISLPPDLTFASNVLPDPRSPQKIMHPRSLGYLVNPADLYLNVNNTPMMPYPMNRHGGERRTFTWRDTAVLARGGIGGAGVPMAAEVGDPLYLEDPPAGDFAQEGNVPAVGLPLMWEIRCYPSGTSIGLNAHEVALPSKNFCRPTFRVYSTGGIDTTGLPVTKDPDFELFPTGGFNPNSGPPGQPTPLDTDPTFYLGQLDVVVRISRAHSIWIDTAALGTSFLPPVVEPSSNEQPAGTEILLEFRGADAIDPAVGNDPFDAAALDFLGDLPDGVVQFHEDDGTWTDDIQTLDGARYVQVRISFINNIDSGQAPELDSLGIAWQTN